MTTPNHKSKAKSTAHRKPAAKKKSPATPPRKREGAFPDLQTFRDKQGKAALNAPTVENLRRIEQS